MVLGASQLTLQPAWQAGSGSGAPAAVLPTPSGCLAPFATGGALLLDHLGTACELEGSEAPAGACSAAGQALLVLGPRALLLADLAPGRPPELRTIDLDVEGPPACIAEAASAFAVGVGRHVLVLDEQGQQLRRIGPLPAPVQHVCWPGADAAVGLLLAATPSGLHCWRDGGAAEGCELLLPAVDPQQPPQYGSLAAALGAPLIAAACTTANEVHCWDLAPLLSGGDGDPGQPLRLQEFEGPVEVLEWDSTGQYLATADGSDCAVWDLADASGAERGQSIACCGHEARSRITALAFQPDGHLLATASSTGKVAVFDCRQFRRGGVLGPVAYAVLDPHSADAATTLGWLPGGRLVVGAASGRLVCLQLSEQPTLGQSAEAAGGAAALVDGMARLNVVPERSASAAASAEGSPAAAAAPAGTMAEAAGEASAAAMAAATAAAAAALAGPAGRACHSGAADGAADEDGTHSSNSLPAAGPSTPRSKGDQEMAAGQYDNGNGSGHSVGSGGPEAPEAAAVPAFPPGQVPPPINLTRHSSESSGGSGGRGRRAGRGRNAAAAAAADPAAPGAGGSGSAGFSASLMHHIQAIRENPPQGGHGRGHAMGGGAGNQVAQLSGWGLGSPSGPSYVPWMMAAGQPAGQMAAAAVMQGGGGGGGPQGFAAFQAQAVMMQRMAMGPQGAPASPYMAPASPGSPQSSPGAFPAQPGMYAGGATPGMGAAVPMMAAGGGGPMGLAPVGNGGGPGMPAMGGGGWVMMAPPAAFLQSVQQWAGTAPGYMVYQHQQAPQFGGVPAAGGGSARASRLSNNSTGGPASPNKSGSMSPRGSGGSCLARTGSGGLGRVASGGLPHFPSRMESALGGVPTTSRQESLDRAAAAALEAAQAQHSALHGMRTSNGRHRNGNGDREVLQHLHAAAAAAEGGAFAAAAARERREEQGNDAQGSATSAAAEEASRGRRAAQPPPARGAGSSGGSGTSGTASASLLSPARSGDLNNIDYAGGGNGSASNSSSQPELAGAAHGGATVAADASGAVSTVYVGNLPGTVDEYTLACAFAPFGPITHVQVIKEKGSQLSRGYGFVSYAHPVYATVAMQHMNQQVLFGPFNGSRIKVAPTKRS